MKIIYQTTRTNLLNNGERYPTFEQFIVSHFESQNNSYLLGTYGGDSLEEPAQHSIQGVERNISVSNLTNAFSNSDFWLCDLGLEFFHWPQQKVLKKEIHRSCGCTVLESTNPSPTANGYSRVVSWIDNDSLGIVEAYAYDSKNKLLKDFYPKDIKKVNGQWQVQTLVMENVQTGSRSRLEFDLKK